MNIQSNENNIKILDYTYIDEYTFNRNAYNTLKQY